MSDNILQLNEAAIKGELKDLVKSSVEETLNALLEHEADELVNAERYERSGDRKGYRSGHYDRNFTTTSGDVTLHVPKLKGVQFETAIIERYRRRGEPVFPPVRSATSTRKLMKTSRNGAAARSPANTPMSTWTVFT